MQNVHDGSKQTLIMIVDDDAALGEMLSIVLNSSGFETVTCQDGLRAVEMFPTLHPDLVIAGYHASGIGWGASGTPHTADRQYTDYHAHRQIRYH